MQETMEKKCEEGVHRISLQIVQPSAREAEEIGGTSFQPEAEHQKLDSAKRRNSTRTSRPLRPRKQHWEGEDFGSKNVPQSAVNCPRRRCLLTTDEHFLRVRIPRVPTQRCLENSRNISQGLSPSLPSTPKFRKSSRNFEGKPKNFGKLRCEKLSSGAPRKIGRHCTTLCLCKIVMRKVHLRKLQLLLLSICREPPKNYSITFRRVDFGVAQIRNPSQGLRSRETY